MKKYVIFGENYSVDFDKKIIEFENETVKKVFEFEKLDEYCKALKNENRINKPTILLLYSDLKNGKGKNWEFAEI